MTAGPVTTVVLGVSDNEAVADVFFYPFTESDPYYNDDQNVGPLNLEIWRTENGLDVFYLDQVGVNDASATTGYTLHFFDDTSDDDLVLNELLYTQSGELDNVKAPAVKALEAWQNYLFALVGDGSIWNSKPSVEGFGAEFSDALRQTIDDTGGKPVGLGKVDATLVIFKAEKTYVMQGQGPDEKGAGGFGPIQPLSADLGIVGPNARVDTPSGILCQTSKGLFTLTRAIAFEQAEGPDGFFSGAVITGGINLKSRSMSMFVTTGSVLCLEWDFGCWSSWSKSAAGLAGVAAARWLGKSVIFRANGTALVEVEGQYFDDTSTAITERLDFNYFNGKNGRVYSLQFIGDWPATTTLSETITFDYDSGTAETKTKAVTSAEKSALPVVPSRGRFNSLSVTLQETSTTEGFRLSGVDLEIGPKQGLKKPSPSRRFT